MKYLECGEYLKLEGYDASAIPPIMAYLNGKLVARSILTTNGYWTVDFYTPAEPGKGKVVVKDKEGKKLFELDVYIKPDKFEPFIPKVKKKPYRPPEPTAQKGEEKEPIEEEPIRKEEKKPLAKKDYLPYIVGAAVGGLIIYAGTKK